MSRPVYGRAKLFELLDQLGGSWRNAVIPLYVPAQAGPHEVLGTGTGYFVQWHDVTFLVTAYHVLHQARLAAGVIANIGGVGVSLGGVVFTTDKPADIAVAYIPDNWLAERGITRLLSLPLPDPHWDYTRVNRFFVLGYPGRLNTPSAGRGDRHLLSISMEEDEAPPPADVGVANPLVFHYDPAAVMDATLNAVTDVPRLNGMSGDPVLQVLYRTAGPALQLAVRLRGTTYEWYPERQQVVASHPAALEALLTRVCNAPLLPPLDKPYDQEDPDVR